MAMKAWEREIIEYRPNIEFRRSIRTRIIKEVETQETGLTYKPTIVVERLLQKPASQIINKLLATLSKAYKRLQDLKKELADEQVYIDYEKAREENDPARMLDIYLEYIKDIDGHPSFIVYPMLDDYMEEMEDFLDFVNDMLFDGTVDYNNPLLSQKNEEAILEQIIQVESEDLSVPKEYEFTKEQIKIIEEIIKDPDSGFDSVKDYGNAIKDSVLQQGSPNINYSELTNRVQIIEVLDKKTDMFGGAIDSIGNQLDKRLPDFVKNDLTGAIDYIFKAPNPKPNPSDWFPKPSTPPSNGPTRTPLNPNLMQQGIGQNPGATGIPSLGVEPTIDYPNNPDSTGGNSPGTDNIPSLGTTNNDTGIGGTIGDSSGVSGIGLDPSNEDDSDASKTSEEPFKAKPLTLESIQKAAKMGHRYHAGKTITRVKNMKRIADDDLRKFLDEELAKVSKAKEELVDELRNNLGDPGEEGAISLFESVTDTVREVNNLWKFILVEHLGTTELNVDQLARLFGAIDSKQTQQMLNQLCEELKDTPDIGNPGATADKLSEKSSGSSKFW